MGLWAVAPNPILFCDESSGDEGKPIAQGIGGGRDGPFRDDLAVADTASLVRNEGQRRLAAAGLAKYEAREQIIGIPMPRALKIFKFQIEFAVTSLSRLCPLPVDYRADGYWPKMDADRDLARSAPKDQANLA